MFEKTYFLSVAHCACIQRYEVAHCYFHGKYNLTCLTMISTFKKNLKKISTYCLKLTST